MQANNKADFNEYEAFSLFKKTNDSALKEKIAEHYLYIVEILSRRFTNKGIDYDDIYQVACLGLILAIDRFDPDKNIKFSTYATPTILGEIRKYFRDKGYFIKIPRRLYEIFYRSEKIKNTINSEKCTPEELSAILNIPEKIIQKAYDMGDIAFVRSLENDLYADESGVPSDVSGSDDKNFLMIENKDFIESCLKSMDEKEKEFIDLRYYKEYTQKQISEIWNISQMQVSRFERKTLKKLRDLYFC